MKDTSLIIDKTANGFIVRPKTYDHMPSEPLQYYVFESFGTLKMFLAQWSSPPKASK